MSGKKAALQQGQDTIDHKKRKSRESNAANAPKHFQGTSAERNLHVHFTPQEILQIRAKLLAWYDKHHRVLPWRRNPHSKREASPEEKYSPVNPDTSQQQFAYMVWVCEIMSQQTQVPRVAEYWTRWISKWPTVQDLAAASQDEVNAMWAGLGYYRRARFLLDGAKYVAETLSGQMPVTAAELQKIPGNEQVAVVDANVVRVLARLRKLTGDSKGSAATKVLAGLADALVDPDRPGCFNQAMMELGACVCTVHQPPACFSCPINQHCNAYADVQQFLADGGDAADTDMPLVTQYPAKVVKPAKRKEQVAVYVVELKGSPDGLAEGAFLLVQRPAQGLLAGLWDFPSRVLNPEEPQDQEYRQELFRQLLDDLIGLSQQDNCKTDITHLGTATHTFSHIQQTMIIDHMTLKGLDSKLLTCPSTACTQWVSRKTMDTMGLSSGVKKSQYLLAQHGRPYEYTTRQPS